MGRKKKKKGRGKRRRKRSKVKNKIPTVERKEGVPNEWAGLDRSGRAPVNTYT